MQKKSISLILMSLIISIGIMGCGFFISKGFYASRVNQPYITVKGLAERRVKADFAVLNISYTAIGDDISSINNELLRQQLVVTTYVKNQGFTENEISFDQIRLVDKYAVDYGANKPEHRYLIKGGIKIRSHSVDRISQASQITGELIKQGVALSSDADDTTNPAFYFTQLNSIRPSMISEATESAHNVAAQFANDTRSRLSSIRRAYQGIFEITSPDASGVADNNNAWQLRREEQASIFKKIRLVSTIDYFLEK